MESEKARFSKIEMYLMSRPLTESLDLSPGSILVPIHIIVPTRRHEIRQREGRHALRERVHVEHRLRHHLLVIPARGPHVRLRIPGGRVAFPATVLPNIVEKGAPERVEAENGGVTDNDEEGLGTGYGH